MRRTRELAPARLRRFSHLSDEAREDLFLQPPRSPREARTAFAVGMALGAVLYGPATNPSFASRLIGRHWPGVTAAVVCLEDAIGDARLAEAELGVREMLGDVARAVDAAGTRDGLPLLFVRVRGPEHLEALLADWGPLAAQVDGVVLPKITVSAAVRHLDVVRGAQSGRDRPLWALPILEGPDIAHCERRRDTLLGLREVLAAYEDLVPGVRIGATDLSGLWGLRRTRDFTVYDLKVVADVVADIVNVLGRADGPPVISGPVWEYVHDEPLFKPPLRETPFRAEFGPEGPALRRELLHTALDGLVRETLLDRVNGLHGKTVIHPSHVTAVDAVYTVSHEEHRDAQAILAAGAGEAGVDVATVGRRMNEPKPHQLWAQRTIQRAEAFGVLRPEHSFLALLAP